MSPKICIFVVSNPFGIRIPSLYRLPHLTSLNIIDAESTNISTVLFNPNALPYSTQLCGTALQNLINDRQRTNLHTIHFSEVYRFDNLICLLKHICNIYYINLDFIPTTQRYIRNELPSFDHIKVNYLEHFQLNMIIRPNKDSNDLLLVLIQSIHPSLKRLYLTFDKSYMLSDKFIRLKYKYPLIDIRTKGHCYCDVMGRM
ncbi:unnamed protein product [Didymodactylos carnosus]|uniref:Uncharacterized protein n=1 Tax=Didymodactylos carnosus TaxID=1234261 RepID=A0A814HQG5_9BILA|nr:unnamed protein product [Didymodactylos carnosus]CAF1014001.1 unnamed protein product [Didymodactylos carnosus]CAF3604483.1 unnamed protein product [Didymodactylos carnosus]CAF3785451.1 unnamed protein product [Didymodactylos carnosus]